MFFFSSITSPSHRCHIHDQYIKNTFSITIKCDFTMIEADGIAHTHTKLINYAQNNTKKKTETNNKKNHFRKSAFFFPAQRKSERDFCSLVLAHQTQKWISCCVVSWSLVKHTQPIQAADPFCFNARAK